MRLFLAHLMLLHFRDSDKEVDKNYKIVEKLWKIREIFCVQCCIYKVLHPFWTFGHWWDGLFRGMVTFKQYIPEKHKHFLNKIYNSVVQLATHTWKDRKHATTIDMRASHSALKRLTGRVKGWGYTLCMADYFYSSDLYCVLTIEEINYCGTVGPNDKQMSDYFRGKTMKLKWGHILLKSCGSKFSQRLQTDICDEYGRACWTASVPTTIRRKAICFGDKNWSPGGEQSPALAYYKWKEDELFSVSCPCKEEMVNSDKGWKVYCWALHVRMFQKLSYKCTGLGHKLLTTGYKRRYSPTENI